MTDKSYLKDFTEPTPLALIRIKECWPFLPFEAKVEILKALLHGDDNEEEKLRYVYQINELKDLAIKDENPYIRYLVAQTISKPFIWGDREETDEYRQDEARYQKVLADKNELVRSVAEEGLGGFSEASEETAKDFWKLSHAKRLMSVSSKEAFSSLSGEVVAKILEYGATELLSRKKISEQEIMDVIQQYVGGVKERVEHTEKYARDMLDGWAEYSLGKDMEALWKTAFHLPDELGVDLIENLPVSAGFMSDIPTDDLKDISDLKLRYLLYRDDVSLNELRREIYEREPNKENESLRIAAISSLSFKLEDDDFRKLTISDSDSEEDGKHKLKELRMLASHCSGATLAQMEAIIDLLDDVPDDYWPGLSHSGEDSCFARRLQEYRAKKLGRRFSQELLDWRIYAFTSYLIGDYAPSATEFLKSDVVSGDRWATYLKIRPKVINKPKIHSELPVLELDKKTYPATESEAENYEDEEDDMVIRASDPIPSWQPQFEVLEKKIKTIFWIVIVILVIVIAQS